MQAIQLHSGLRSTSRGMVRRRPQLESRAFHAAQRRCQTDDESKPKAPSTQAHSSSGSTTASAGLDLRSLASAGGPAAQRPLIRRIGFAGSPDTPGSAAGGAPAQRPTGQFPPRQQTQHPGASSGPRPRGPPSQQRGQRGGRSPSSRRPREAGDEGGGRRGGERSSNNNNSMAGRDEATPAMKAYQAEKEAAKAATTTFTPRSETLEELRAFAPRVPVGAEGAVQMLRHRLARAAEPPGGFYDSTRTADLARRLRAGQYVYLRRGAAERDAVLAEAAAQAEGVEAVKKAKGAEAGEVERPELQTLGDATRDELRRGVLAGEYAPLREPAASPYVESILHLVRKNNTYHGPDEARLVAKIAGLLPANKAQAKQQAAGK